jgi:exodeoxyribonuclease VII large subunit
MLRTAAERWPATRIHVVPIPVQGAVEAAIRHRLAEVLRAAPALGIEALVLARGGGSREDLAVFDSEDLARDLAASPLPVITGLGHEDDTTVADLVADYRAATPTAAIVALLPDRRSLAQDLNHLRTLMRRSMLHRLQSERMQLDHRRQRLQVLHPLQLLAEQRRQLQQRLELLSALSPQRLLQRGFALVRGDHGRLLRSVLQVQPGDLLHLELADGRIDTVAARVHSGERHHQQTVDPCP